jgi:diaminohydroxyphosphoribosylaminopyrimidine deaminase/5-amino-6-(5-phosphoribosylamino)uracil reductase
MMDDGAHEHADKCTADRRMLARAARAALRGFGRVSPNPMVGCVIESRSGEVVTARHDRFGGEHAEATALRLARERGIDVRGARVWVTLEPCDHYGKTPPCAAALVAAGVGEVVAATADPHPTASGGFDTLRSAGVECRLSDASAVTDAVNAVFLTNIVEKRSFVIAKWAQTLDGKLATRTSDSKWITSARARRDVHRLRGRVDAIITGAGTVLADDPRLTARDAGARRAARRVVLDPALRTPPDAALFGEMSEAPLSIITTERSLAEHPDGADRLRTAGAEVWSVSARADRSDTAPAASATDADALDLHAVLRSLFERDGVAIAMLEAGPRLLSAFLDAGCVDQAHVYIAPTLVGDAHAKAIGFGQPAQRMAEAHSLVLGHVKRFGDDVRLVLRRRDSPAPVGRRACDDAD